MKKIKTNLTQNKNKTNLKKHKKTNLTLKNKNI